jgi:hypothetical protein
VSAVQRLAVAALILAGLACSPPAAESQGAPSAAAASAQELEIDHLVPRRDSVGPAPARFEWTPVKGADSYAIGVWNEVDMLLWQQAGIATTSIDRPKELQLVPGTYFWSVSALRGGQQIADSGLAAFVVKE